MYSASFLLAAGCASVHDDDNAAPGGASALSDTDVTAVHIGLISVDQLPNSPPALAASVLDSLVRDNVVSEDHVELSLEGSVSKDLHSGLVGEAGLTQWYGQAKQGGVVRVDGYFMKADFKPVRSASSGPSGALTFPFAAAAGSRVEFAKVYANAEQARAAARPSLWSIPADATRALALSEGTYVTIPMTGELNTRVDGSFLTKAAATTIALRNRLSASATGSLSAKVQGALVARGNFVFEIIRLKGNFVRLRVGNQRTLTASGKLDVAARSNEFKFIPATTLERARSFRSVFARSAQAQAPTDTPDVASRISALTKTLSPPLKSLLADTSVIGVDNPALKSALEQALRTTDPAIALAQGASSNPNELETRTQLAVDGMLANTDAKVRASIKIPAPQLRRFTDSTVSIGAAVDLSGEVTQQVQSLGDYIFDLSTIEGREAYEHAISGRALWAGSRDIAGAGWSIRGRTLADLTFAEALAEEDQGKSSPRVVRVANIDQSLRRSAIGITFSGLGARTSFNRKGAQQTLTTVDSAGNRSTRRAELAEFSHDQRLIGSSRSETLASGFTSVVGDAAAPSLASYWFRWEQNLRSTSDPLGSSLATALNFLGPRGARIGIPMLYATSESATGSIKASLDVVIEEKALRSFFNAPLETLWTSLGRMAETYDNQFGLPHIGKFAPNDDVPEANSEKASCAKVAKAWGDAYCGYFRARFAELPTIAPEKRVDYLKKYYEASLLANPIGSKVLVRLLNQVLSAQGVTEGVYVRLALEQPKNPSSSAAPGLEVGASEEAAVALSALEALR